MNIYMSWGPVAPPPHPMVMVHVVMLPLPPCGCRVGVCCAVGCGSRGGGGSPPPSVVVGWVCAVLSCAVLCCAVLLCAVLCCAVLCCAHCALLCMRACVHGHITSFFLFFHSFSLLFLYLQLAGHVVLGTIPWGGARNLEPTTYILLVLLLLLLPESL